MNIDAVTAAMLVGAFVAASIVLFLSAAAWLRIRQRRVEHALESLRTDVSFGREDTTWLLREALRVAERLPQFAGSETNARSRRKRGQKR